MLMITEAAIEFHDDTQNPFEYAGLAYWLDRHNDLCYELYGIRKFSRGTFSII